MDMFASKYIKVSYFAGPEFGSKTTRKMCSFQTSIKHWPWCIPEDPMVDPDKASTEESKTGIELQK